MEWLNNCKCVFYVVCDFCKNCVLKRLDEFLYENKVSSVSVVYIGLLKGFLKIFNFGEKC